MALRPNRPCRKPGCNAITKDRKGYCEKHIGLASGWARPERGNSADRGYGHKWRKLRAKIMERDKGLCQPCLKTGRIVSAHAVDHITPKAQGGTDEPENLQAICKPCHKAKTQEEANAALRAP